MPAIASPDPSRRFLLGSAAALGLMAVGATRAIDLNGSLANAWKQMTDTGLKRINASDIS